MMITAPYKHQTDAIEKARDKSNFAFFCEAGTGKTRMIIEEIINLIDNKKINAVLIIAPNELHAMWETQFNIHVDPKWLEKNVQIQVYRSKFKDKQEQTTRDIIKSGKILILCMNIEAISTDYGYRYAERVLLARKANYLVIDESQKIKTPGVKRTKRAIVLGRRAMYRRIATGTEAEEGLHELFSQMRFLNPKITGHSSYTSFSGMFCKMGGFENRQIIGYQNQDILAERIAPYCFQIRKKQCIDLPEQTWIEHHIDLTPEQLSMYLQLTEDLLLELESGELIDVTLAITKLLRLQQIVCGHLGGELIPSSRASYVSELIEAAGSKVLVFCRFKKDVDLMSIQLTAYEMGHVCCTGETPPEERTERINSWRKDKNLKTLVMTSAVGGLGLTLNEANTTIYYSNGWSSTERIQSEARNHRIGQEDKVTYHDVIVPHSIDERILKTLKKKQDIAQMFRNLIDIKQFLIEETKKL